MKRLIPLLLSLILTVSAVCVPISAEDAATTTVGYSADLIEEASASGIRDIENYNGWANFKISTAKGLVMFSHIVNRTISNLPSDVNENKSSFSGKTLWLTADIDMSETIYYCYSETEGYDFSVTSTTENALSATASELFVPIGTTTEFRGTFDGQGYTIKNMNVEYETRAGLFCKAGVSAQIKNVIMDQTCSFKATASSNATAAAIVGYLFGNATVSNCISMASLSGHILGGIVGEGASATATISNCTNATSITGISTAGGIVGKGVIQISNCRNAGDITANSFVGGIMGWSTGATVINNCVNNADIKCANGGYAGGIVGRAQTISSIGNCKNYGVLGTTQPNNPYTTGAIIAYNQSGYDTEKDSEGNSLNNADKIGETDQSLIDQMLAVKVQLPAGATANDVSTSLRLISSIDSADYEQVYFVISLSDTDVSLTDHKEYIDTVYTTIGETKETALIKRTAYAEFAPQSQFFSTFTITDIGSANFDMTVTVQMFAVDMSGNTISGEKTSFVINDLFTDAAA